MEIYYVIFLLAFFLCVFDFFRHKVYGLVPYFLFCIFLIMLAGFRDLAVDNDSLNYAESFNFYKNVTISDIIKGGYGFMERGYVLLNKIVSSLGFEINTLLIVMALITGFTNYYFFYKKSRYTFLSLLFYLSFYFLYRDFTQIRYAFAASLCFWVVTFYVEKKYNKAILFFILATLFHNTAFILIPVLLFIRYVKNNRLYFIPIIPAFIIGRTINLFYLILLTGFLGEHMDIYKQEAGEGGGMMVSAIGLLIMILYIFVTHKKRERDELMDFYFKILSLGVSLNLLFFKSAIFQRFSYVLFQFAILILPYILEEVKRRLNIKETFILIYFLASCFLLYYGMNMIDPNLVRPYKTFF